MDVDGETNVEALLCDIMQQVDEETIAHFDSEVRLVGCSARPRTALQGLHHPDALKKQSAERWVARKRAKLQLKIKEHKENADVLDALARKERAVSSALQRKLANLKTPDFRTVVLLQGPDVTPGQNHLTTPQPTFRRSSLSRKRSPSPR